MSPLTCPGCSVLAGFWNAHVHFTEPVWLGAATAPAPKLRGALTEMLLQYGFVHVLDTGSDLDNTVVLRSRIAKGELPGPDILTAGFPFAPPGGTPFYIKPLKLPELVSPAAARDSVLRRLARGADFIKVFAASPVSIGRVVEMPPAILQTVTAAAHAKGRWVAAHPTTNAGADLAIAAGVDLLLHTTPDGGKPWDVAFVKRMIAARVAVAPTLMLWRWELERAHRPAAVVDGFLAIARQQAAAFSRAGGDLVFGTDVGYVAVHDPSDEYRLLTDAGIGFDAVLASLTTIPARRFSGGRSTGRLEPGADADIVLVAGRPDRDPTAFTRVETVWKRGLIVYHRGAPN